MSTLHGVRSEGAAAIAVLTLLLVYAVVGWTATGGPALPLDDSWIHLELARHLAAGEGLAYETGLATTASTAPLWTALLALGFGIVDPVWWSLVLGTIFLALTVLGTARLAAALELPPLARLAGPWIVATTPWLLWSGLSGMEVPLALALTTWGLAEHHRALRSGDLGDRRGLALLAFAPLARPEALLLLALALLDRWPRTNANERRIDLLLAVLGVAPTAAVYTVLSGSPLPTTLSAKAGGGSGFALAAATRLGRVAVDVFLRSLPILTLFSVPGLVRRLGRGSTKGWAALLWAPGLVAAYAAMSSPGTATLVGNFGRYLFPLLPLVALFGLAGLDDVLPLRGAARKGALAVLAATQVALLAGGPGVYRHTLQDVEATDVAAARWLASEAPSDLLVGAQDVGAVGFLAPQRVLDLVGLIEPEVQEVLREEDGRYWEERLLDYLGRRRPDLLMVFRRSYPMLTSERSGFRVLARFERPQNRTMAGTELLVLATPWCRWEPPSTVGQGPDPGPSL